MTKTANLAQLASIEAQGDTGSPYETSFGYQAGNVSTGQRNSFFGYQAGLINAGGVDLSAFGFQALPLNTSGSQNTAVGAYSMNGNTGGGGNTAVGYYSMVNNASNNYNCAFGALALYGAQSNNNCAVGAFSMYQLQSGGNNTSVGANAGYTAVSNSNITCLGYDSSPSSNSVSNEVTLGNNSISALRCATTTITSLSDERDKKNIIDLPAGLAFINAVKPVAFDWNARDESKIDIPDTGFLAQNLQQVQAQLGITIPGLVYDTNPEKLEAGYSKLLPVLVKAIQELSARVEALEAAQ